MELLGARPEVGFAIASQTPFSAAIRRCPPGRVSERDATDLALTPYAIARLLVDEYQVTDPEAGLRVAELTSGWPALVHFCGDVLSRDNQADLASAMTVIARRSSGMDSRQRAGKAVRRRARGPPAVPRSISRAR